MSVQALVPVMTSDTTPTGYGECICSSYYAENYRAYIAFNGSTFNLSRAGTFWGPSSQDNNQWIGFKFSTKKRIFSIVFKTAQEYYSAGYSGDIDLMASNNSTDWTVLKSYTIISPYYTAANLSISIDVPSNDGYLYWAIKFKYPYAVAGEMQFYGNDPIDAAGDITAIKDWLNSSLYNKDEITGLFVQNNSGLQAYDLTFVGDEDQFIKVVGQTSGKSYLLCLDMLGELYDMKETVLWTNSGSTNPSTIELLDDWTNYKFLTIIGKTTVSAGDEVLVSMYPVTTLNTMYINSLTPIIGATEGTPCVWYKLAGTKNLTLHASNTYIIYQILGYE